MKYSIMCLEIGVCHLGNDKALTSVVVQNKVNDKVSLNSAFLYGPLV